jgi:hypothetical protein
VERLVVTIEAAGFVVEADVRNTDVRASAGDVERRALAAADLRSLQDVLASLKALDPARKRITLVPGPATTTQQVVSWMDAVKVGPRGELFPEVILQSIAGGQR